MATSRHTARARRLRRAGCHLGPDRHAQRHDSLAQHAGRTKFADPCPGWLTIPRRRARSRVSRGRTVRRMFKNCSLGANPATGRQTPRRARSPSMPKRPSRPSNRRAPRRVPSPPITSESDRSAVWAWATGFLAAAGLGGALLGWSSCHGKSAQPVRAVTPVPASAAAARSAAPSTDAGLAMGADAGTKETNAAPEGPLVGSMVNQAPIYSAMDSSREKRIGYIRHGAKRRSTRARSKRATARPGWYHLLGGGYVCGKYVDARPQQPAGPPGHHAAQPRRRSALSIRVEHHDGHAALQVGSVARGHAAVRALLADSDRRKWATMPTAPASCASD